MNEQAQKLNAIVAGILIMASLLGVAVLTRGRSASPRPPQTASETVLPTGKQTIPSRLWQDPFEAFEKATNRAAASAEAKSSQTNSTPLQARAATVLAVMLEAAPYPEDKETRRRLRYAVEMALLTSDFAPEDRSHIGVANLVLNTNSTGTQRVAFEWFSSSTNSSNFLVLWLPEEDFAQGGMSRFRSLREALNATNYFYIIGPRSSDTLRLMASTGTNSNPGLATEPIRIFSPHATAPDSALFSDLNNSLRRDDLVSKFGTNTVFQTWIATDQQLSERIVEELLSRGIGSKPGKEPKANEIVVLISEADTFYGRSLPQTLKAGLTGTRAFTSNSIWQFGYLRGLEGIKPADAEKKEESKPPTTPEALLQAALTRKGEVAEGEGQQDYARRFASYLAEQESRYSAGGARIRAIGLTGSDFYDKLVLLNALRPQFPEALFFTTDLHAGYWASPGQLSAARNLLVASSYPLEPGSLNGIPQPFMPFRDVYQAATFAACKAALEPPRISPNTAPNNRLEGSVYEIGRHGPVFLSRPPDQPDNSSEGNVQVAQVLLNLFVPWPLILDRASQLPVNIYAAFLGVVLLVAAFLTFILRQAPDLEGFEGSPDLETNVSESRQREHQVVTCSKSSGNSGDSGAPTPASISQGASGAQAKAALPVRQHSFQDADGPPASSTEETPHTPRVPARSDLPPVIPSGFRIGSGFYCGSYLPVIVASVSALVFIMGAAVSESIAGLPGEEPWVFDAGVSMWGTEALRVVAVLFGAIFLSLALVGECRDRLYFWKHFFCPAPNVPLELPLTRSLVADLSIAGWQKRVAAASRRGILNASELFLGYANMGRPWKRWLRTVLNAFLLMLGFMGVTTLLGEMPSRTCIRGDWSRIIDLAVLFAAVLTFFCVLFYAIDATRLASRMLTYLSAPTRWPAWRRAKTAREESVCETDTDPMLDLKFAVEHTQHVRRLMLYPFIILLLLLISRSSYIEAWTWPFTLTGIFVLNFTLAATCWAALRKSARTMKTSTLRQLHRRAIEFENAGLAELRSKPTSRDTGSLIRAGEVVYTPESYGKRLRQVIEKVQKESGGAFAHWIQDPTYLFLFIPTGVTGLLTMAVHYFLN